MIEKSIMVEKNMDRDAELSTQVHTFNVRGLRDKTKRNRLFKKKYERHNFPIGNPLRARRPCCVV
jgi:hypothetical protein